MFKGKFTSEDKIKIAEQYLAGKGSYDQLGREFGCSDTLVRELVVRYKASGPSAFTELEHTTKYSAEVKIQAVTEYVSGQGSLKTIAAKYGLRTEKQLRSWIKVYNSGGNFKYKILGRCHMSKGRETTLEERVEIAKDCIENGGNYDETAGKYDVSYQQVRTWVKKFKEFGEKGLEDRRGKRITEQEPRTELEAMKIKLAQLEHENYMLKMERDLLKKLKELEGGDAYLK